MIVKTFYDYDMDGNGYIDELELQHAFQKRGHDLSFDEVLDTSLPDVVFSC
jgi:hypothetical protein